MIFYKRPEIYLKQNIFPYKRNISLFFIGFVFLVGCQTGNKDNSGKFKVDKYFDLAGLVQQQIEDFSSIQPNALKIAGIDGKNDTIISNELNWKKELSMFAEADINKPKLLSQYEIINYKNDRGEEVTEYKNIQDISSGVVSIKLINDQGREILSRIHIESCEKNILFTSELSMTMNFVADDNAEITLKAYSIHGFEKVLLKDTMQYFVSTQIQL